MTVDTATVVAALVAAKNIDALEAAISQGSFLDAIPGDDRQKLRGATATSARSVRRSSRPRTDFLHSERLADPFLQLRAHG